MFLFIFFSSLFFFNLQATKFPTAANGKHRHQEHKPEVTGNESSGSASGSNSEGSDNVKGSPAKRRKKEHLQYVIKKVLDVLVAIELAQLGDDMWSHGGEDMRKSGNVSGLPVTIIIRFASHKTKQQND
jgi:hypothetical protein